MDDETTQELLEIERALTQEHEIKSETMVENPFPEIGGILFDEEKMKVFCTHYRSKEDTMKNIEEDKIQTQMNK